MILPGTPTIIGIVRRFYQDYRVSAYFNIGFPILIDRDLRPRAYNNVIPRVDAASLSLSRFRQALLPGRGEQQSPISVVSPITTPIP